MKADLLAKYKAALNKAETTEKLKCHVIAIQKTIEALEAGAEPTTLDVVWVDYFLSINFSAIPKKKDFKEIRNGIFVEKSFCDRWYAWWIPLILSILSIIISRA